MQQQSILIIGGGIGGLCAAIALGRAGHRVTVIEKDPEWSVYGVGIIQQSNVVRAMESLGVLDSFLSAASGFDAVEIFIPDGTCVARVPSPRLVEGRPANVGISRKAFSGAGRWRTRAWRQHPPWRDRQRVRGSRRHSSTSPSATATAGDFDFAVGADGVNSQTRATILPDGRNAAVHRPGGVALQLPAARRGSTRCRSITGRSASGSCRCPIR